MRRLRCRLVLPLWRPAGACPVGRRITLPFQHPAGGLPSLSPVYPAFCLLSCPHPPTRARRALFPAGRGRFLLFYARGFAPCIPRGWRGAALVRRALAAPGGGLPGWSPDNLAVPAPSGGLAVFVACLPCLLLTFLPPSPSPFPAGRGSFCYLMQGASPLASPGAGGARHWLGFEETIRFGIAGGRRLQLQSITNLRKVLGGLGASFKKPPNVSPPLASPRAGGTRHWLGFEEAILFGIAGGRRLQLQSITNSRKVLGGLGASFKKPPTFLRSPVPSFSRSFALPFLRSPVLKRLTGQDKPALSVVLGLFTEGYGYACGGSGQPRRAAGR